MPESCSPEANYITKPNILLPASNPKTVAAVKTAGVAEISERLGLTGATSTSGLTKEP